MRRGKWKGGEGGRVRGREGERVRARGVRGEREGKRKRGRESKGKEGERGERERGELEVKRKEGERVTGKRARGARGSERGVRGARIKFETKPGGASTLVPGLLSVSPVHAIKGVCGFGPKRKSPSSTGKNFSQTPRRCS
jgi:hypothetical protein